MAGMSRIEKRARTCLAQEGGVVARTSDSGQVFDLAYIRTGPRGAMPVVVIPGGPGLASLAPYAAFRKEAACEGLGTIMIEHRGVGFSGRTHQGEPLPPEDVTIEAAADDIAAVLNELEVPQAVIVGSSYGTYLAQAFAVQHPQHVAALVLESPILSPVEDLDMVRHFRRELLWEGTKDTSHLAELMRKMATRGVPMADFGMVVQIVYEFAGPEMLERLLRARLAGRLGWLWQLLARVGGSEIDGPGVPYLVEPAGVAGIAFGQLGYGLDPDGDPLDPQLAFAPVAGRKPAFRGAPFDLVTEVPRYGVPVVVVSGDRDLRTPRPVAERIVNLAGVNGTLIPLADTGHSVLDTHPLALIQIISATRDHEVEELRTDPARWAAVPRKGSSRWVGHLLSVVIGATTRPACSR